MKPITAYDLVRVSLAGVLLLAAGLKGYELATEPVLRTGLLDSRWFLIGVVEFELLFGLWLLAQVKLDGSVCLLWRICMRLALQCSFWRHQLRLFRPCYGKYPTSSRYTFAMAVGAVLALLRWQAFEPSSSTRHLSWTPARRVVAVTSVWFVSGPLVGWRGCRLK